MLDTVAALVRRNGTHPQIRQRRFILFGDESWSHEEYYRQCCRYARLFLAERPQDRPFHIGVLLDNVPEYLFALGGAALAGAVVVGINPTQRGDYLARDVRHTDCGLLLTEGAHGDLLAPIKGDLGIPDAKLFVVGRGASEQFPFGNRLESALAAQPEEDPELSIAPQTPLCLVFTSGTTGAPKAVVISQQRMCSTAAYVGGLMSVGAHDVGYLAMPLFHANAQQCGFMPALLHGATLGMIRRFSRSQWLADIRRYRVTYFNYTGKPLAYILTTPRRPDDADNPLRVAYGNEGSPRITAEFAERFGCKVIDGFGASEGGFGFFRQPGDPPGSVGKPAPEIQILDESGKPCPPARLDAAGRILNPDQAIGEIVNTAGVGKFEGYYRNELATRERTRGGMYWSGDFGYKDAGGYVYFTGRDISWIRVDGENFLAKPIEDILQRHPAVYLCCVYGVPDAQAGDRVMATLVLAETTPFDGSAFVDFLRSQPDMSPKWRPTYVRLARDLPRTATHKPLVRQLRQEKFCLERLAGDALYWHEGVDEAYRAFGPEEYARLRESFRASGRESTLDV